MPRYSTASVAAILLGQREGFRRALYSHPAHPQVQLHQHPHGSSRLPGRGAQAPQRLARVEPHREPDARGQPHQPGEPGGSHDRVRNEDIVRDRSHHLGLVRRRHREARGSRLKLERRQLRHLVRLRVGPPPEAMLACVNLYAPQVGFHTLQVNERGGRLQVLQGWPLHGLFTIIAPRDAVHAPRLPVKKLSASQAGAAEHALLRPGDALRLPGYGPPGAYLRTQGVSVEAIGFLGACWPCRGCSRRCGLRSWIATARCASARRKSWILPLQAALAVTCAWPRPSCPGWLAAGAARAHLPDEPLRGHAGHRGGRLRGGLAAARGAGLRQRGAGGGLQAGRCSREAACSSGRASTSAGRGCSSPWRRSRLVAFAMMLFAREPAPPAAAAPRSGRAGARCFGQHQGGAAACRGRRGCCCSSAPTSSASRCRTCSTSSSSSTPASGPSRLASGSGTWGTVASIIGSAVGGLLATRVPLF